MNTKKTQWFFYLLLLVFFTNAQKLFAQNLVNKNWQSSIYLKSSYFWKIKPNYANKISNLGFTLKGKYKKLHFKQDLFYNFYEKIFYLKSEEMFLEYTPWFIGQKKHLWSWADSLWSNNLWQAQFYQNPVHSLDMGLLGLHLNKTFNKYAYYIFFSPVFLPRYSSNRNIQSGKISSFTPWLRSLPSQINQLPVKYIVDRFSIWNLLNQHSLALQLEYYPSAFSFLRSSLSHKASNNIFLSIAPQVSAKNIQVAITPYTAKETVFNIEAGVDKKFWKLMLSSSFRAYNKIKLKKNYLADQLSDALLYNLYYDVYLNSTAYIFASYQKVLNYKAKSYNKYIVLQETLFAYPYDYLDAIKLGFNRQGFNTEYQFTGSYDFKQKAVILSFNSLWQPVKYIKLSFNFTQFYRQASLAYNSNFFLHKFSKNSFVQLGVNYVF